MFRFNKDFFKTLNRPNKRAWIIGAVAALAVIDLFIISADQISFTDEALAKKEITFNVPPGTPAARIPAILEKAGVEVNDF